MEGIQKGDTVYYHINSGEVRVTVVTDLYRDWWVVLRDTAAWISIDDVYDTQEAAEEALSPVAKRMEGCLREAGTLYGCRKNGTDTEFMQSQILEIAFRLYDSGE